MDASVLPAASWSHFTLALLPWHLWTLTDNICSFPEISLQQQSLHSLPILLQPGLPLFKGERSCQSNGTGWINEGSLGTWPLLARHTQQPASRASRVQETIQEGRKAINLTFPSLWPTSVTESCSAQFTEFTPPCWALEAKGKKQSVPGNSVRVPRLSMGQTHGPYLSTPSMVLG